MKSRLEESAYAVLDKLKTDSNLLCSISCPCAMWNKAGWWGSRIGCLIINFLKQKSIASVKKDTNNEEERNIDVTRALRFILMFNHFQGKHIILKHKKIKNWFKKCQLQDCCYNISGF